MKRILVVILASLLALTVWAQGVDMYHIDYSRATPGIAKSELYRRTTAWNVDARNQFNTIHDYAGEPYAQSLEFMFRPVQFGLPYRDASISFRITIISKDQEYIVRLDRLFVSCYKGQKTVFCVEQMPERADGYFPNNRLQKDRVAICSLAQSFAKDRFEELLPGIQQIMENGRSEFRLIQE